MTNPLVPVLNNDQLDDMQRKEMEATTPQPDQQMIVDELAGHVRLKWDKAVRAKQPIKEMFLQAKRARENQYEPTKLAAIRAMHGSKYNPPFMPIVMTKCRAGEAWIRDILVQPEEEPWDLEPTPLPELPEDVETAIYEQVFQQIFTIVASQMQAAGIPPDPAVIMERIINNYDIIKDRVDREIKKKAKKAAEEMKEKIGDQFAEGGWHEAFDDFIYDIVTYGTGVIKGHTILHQKVYKRKYDPLAQGFVGKVEREALPKWQRRSPFNIYPGPDNTDTNDGYIFDKFPLSRKQLNELIGLPGYKTGAIKEVLEKHKAGGLVEWTAAESEKAQLEKRTGVSIHETELMDTLEFWGTVPGGLLLDWGMSPEKIPEPTKEYNVGLWMIGDIVIKAMLNPDPLGENPFSKACFDNDPDAFWGKGIPFLLKAIQDMGNALARSITQNVGIASGPMVEVNIDRLAAGTTTGLHPWKEFFVTNDQMNEGQAVRFWQPELIADRLAKLYEFVLTLADEDSGVPRYAHGQTQVAGAGQTSSGLSMLMTSAARGIKNVVKNIDKDVIKKTVRRIYQYNMMFEEERPNILGDCKVVPKGTSSLIAKEQQAVRRTEFMKNTMNPVDMAIVGMEGRKHLLKQTAKALEIDIEKVFQEEAEIDQMAMSIMAPNTGTPEDAATLDNAGQPVVGQDTRTFNEGERQTA